MQQPEVRQQVYSAAALSKRAKTYSSRMTDERRALARDRLNAWRQDPVRRAEVIAKTGDALRGRPWVGKRGGNGTGPTLPEEVLLALLGPGWEWQVGVLTDDPALPPVYKVDIAHREKKVAVEVDGHSHRGRRQEQDQRKDLYLSTHGWQVLRFWNQDILRGGGEIADQLRAMTSP